MVKSTLLSPSTRRAAFALVLACAMATGLSLFVASRRAAMTTDRLRSAERQLEALTVGPPETADRGAIAWGYAERMRLGLESPFRLIDAAAQDPRLALEERRTVSWGLLATLLRGESHQVDPAALDGASRNPDVPGEAHLALIESGIRSADDPRAAELALRMAYTLAAAERVAAASSPTTVAQAAALIADREIARREAAQLLRSTSANGTLAAIAESRRRRGLYVERPTLIAPSPTLEQQAIQLMPSILAELRRLARGTSGGSVLGAPTTFQAALAAAASRVPPSPEVTVTARRFLPALKQLLDRTEADRIARAANPEMLAAALAGTWTRPERALLGRLHLATATAMRTHAQEPAWFAVDAGDALERLGVASVSFEAGVPTHWRAYYLASFSAAITSLRTVFPQLTLDGIDVRFRLASPADSALAMHEPKTRTLHLPVGTAAGALTHEIAHDLDRQMSLQQGRAGYWSDAVRRGGDRRARGAAARVAESLRTMTEETAGGRRAADPPERPAEIFATRVDWFVADALARQGIMSGFLSAVQDEVLTGHVLHADRLRGASRSRSLLTALEGMTVVAPFARAEREPTAYSLLQHVLRAPLERRVAREVERPMPLMRLRCGGVARDRSGLVRLAAESRARGIVRARAESIPSARRPGWARAALGEAPWSSDGATERVHAVASELLAQLSAPVLQVGVGARVDALLWSSDCEM